MEHAPYETIELYIRNLMTPADRKAFETQVAADPDLAGEVAFYEALLLHRDKSLAAEWKAKGEKMLAGDAPPLKAATVNRFRIQWAAAASLILMLTATGIWYTQFYNPYGSVVTQYMEPYRYSGDLGVQMPGTEDRDWQRALALYREQSYEQAAILANGLENSRQYADDARLLGGVILIEQNHPEKALQKLRDVRSPVLRQKAQFYSALAFLQDKKPEKARAILTEIAKDGSSHYQDEAREILQKIE
ncbi:MAG: hypothetical protein R2791_12630 [Saprospiraceae bacterium]